MKDMNAVDLVLFHEHKHVKRENKNEYWVHCPRCGIQYHLYNADGFGNHPMAQCFKDHIDYNCSNGNQLGIPEE